MALSCEKYISYDYSAGSIGSRVDITGYLTNKFTGDPVKDARIEFGPQLTSSDSNGYYRIEYVIGVDEQRDRPVNLTIRAANYMPYDRSFILYPVDTVMNIRMEYGAPVIEKIWIGFYSELIIFQARIQDYQSNDNILRVVSEMHYFKDGEPDSRSLTREMTRVAVTDPGRAVYQSVGPPSLGDGWSFDLREFLIAVEDLDGFTTEVNKRSENVVSPDTLHTPIPLP